MHWKRITLFAALGFIATEMAAFPFGFVAGFLRGLGYDAPAAVRFGQAVAVPVAATLALAMLALVQRERIAAHVYITAALMWALSFLSAVLLFGQPPAQWFATMIMLAGAATVALGAALGARKLVGPGTG